MLRLHYSMLLVNCSITVRKSYSKLTAEFQKLDILKMFYIVVLISMAHRGSEMNTKVQMENGISIVINIVQNGITFIKIYHKINKCYLLMMTAARC